MRPTRFAVAFALATLLIGACDRAPTASRMEAPAGISRDDGSPLPPPTPPDTTHDDGGGVKGSGG